MTDQTYQTEPVYAFCSICLRDIEVKPDALPLCKNCRAAGEAHAKQEQTRRLWQRDGQP